MNTKQRHMAPKLANTPVTQEARGAQRGPASLALQK